MSSRQRPYRRRKKQKQFSKDDIKKFQRIHAKCRAAKRYGLILRGEDLEQIVRRIQQNIGELWLLEKESNTRSHWLVYFRDRLVIVVYDSKKKGIATFLPFKDLPIYYKNLDDGQKERIWEIMREHKYEKPIEKEGLERARQSLAQIEWEK